MFRSAPSIGTSSTGQLALIFAAARVSGKMRRANGHRREAPMDFLAAA